MGRFWPGIVALFLVPFVSGPGAAEASWSIDDGTGDQTYGDLAGDPLKPPEGTGDHWDLDQIRVAREDEVALVFVVKVAGFQTGGSWGWGPSFCDFWRSSSGFGGVSGEYETLWFHFTFRDFKFTGKVELHGEWRNTEGRFLVSGATACLSPEEDPRSSSPVQALSVSLDDAKDEFRIRIPKAALLGLGSTPWGDGGPGPPGPRPGEEPRYPDTLAPGDPITDLWFETESFPIGYGFDGPFSNRVYDRAPEAGAAAPYVFATGMANQVVRATIEGGSELPIQAGLNQSVTLAVQNRATGKRILTWEYAVEGRPEVVPRYAVWGPATTSIGGGETRSFYMALNVDGAAQPDDNVTLVARGRSAGHPGELAYGEVVLKPSPPLTPANNVLYLHTSRRETQLGELGCSYGSLERCARPFLSALETDAAADDAEYLIQYGPQGYVGTQFSSNWWLSRIDAVAGSPTALLFDAARKIDFVLATRASGEIAEVNAEVSLLRIDNGTRATTVASVTKPISIPAGEGTVTLQAAFKPKDKLVPRGTRLALGLHFDGPADAGAYQSYAEKGGFTLRPKATQVKLPLLELPEELRNRLVDSPFQFALLGEKDDFVNPGKSRLFNLTLLNQGRESYTARFTATVGADGWSVRFVPASDFKLKSGETIRVGALVYAPSDAAESVPVQVTINVTDPQGHPLGVKLTVIPTSSVPFGDDAERVVADQDAVEAAREANPPAKRSPGFPVPLLLVGLPWLRRRP